MRWRERERDNDDVTECSSVYAKFAADLLAFNHSACLLLFYRARQTMRPSSGRAVRPIMRIVINELVLWRQRRHG